MNSSFRILTPKLSLQEYFAANRSMKTLPLSIALMVSFLSAIAVLGFAAESYAFGLQYFTYCIGYYLIGTPIIAYFYLPVFFKLNAVSVNEVFC